MMHKISINLLFLRLSFFLLLFTGCQDTHDKARDFVDDYNALAPKMATQNLQSTIAELRPDNSIRIVMVSDMAQNEDARATMQQAMPAIMTEVLGRISTFNELIAEGVTFKVEYRANDNSVLAATVLDSASVQNIKAKSEKASTGGYGTTNREAQEMLALVNKTLPIRDEKAGTTVTKIDIVGQELVYFVDIDNELRLALKDPGALAVMKKEIGRNPQLRGFLQMGKGYGIRRIRFKYANAGHTVAEVVLDESEIQ
ncbi:hypothetical protein [Flavobacterium magnum]|nr:hypothetical protein [Flavobacterium magnum]